MNEKKVNRFEVKLTDSELEFINSKGNKSNHVRALIHADLDSVAPKSIDYSTDVEVEIDVDKETLEELRSADIPEDTDIARLAYLIAYYRKYGKDLVPADGSTSPVGLERTKLNDSQDMVQISGFTKCPKCGKDFKMLALPDVTTCEYCGS